MPREVFGCTMDARGDGTAGIFHGETPEVARTKGKRLRRRDCGVVEVVAIFLKIFEELIVVFPTELFE